MIGLRDYDRALQAKSPTWASSLGFHQTYSINSSARTRNGRGSVSPIALDVLRLMTSSNPHWFRSTDGENR